MNFNKYIYQLGFAFLITLSSCSDWLDVESLDTRTTDNFYNTPGELHQALIGIYSGLMPLSEYSLLLSENRSDNTWVTPSSEKYQPYIEIASYNKNITQVDIIESAWKDLYSIIASVNEYITRGSDVVFTKEEIKMQYLAECRFLRALAYFDLVRYFGRVPKITVPITIQEAMKLGQSESIEIYNEIIIPDLLFATEYLIDKPVDYLGTISAEGRATKTAAFALLGRVYLTMAGFPLKDSTKKELAKECFEYVIDYSKNNSDKYWAKTSDEWKEIWISDNDNKYHIFEIQYIAQKDYGNPMAYLALWNAAYLPPKVTSASGNRVNCEEIFRNEFSADGDIRYEATFTELTSLTSMITKFSDHKSKRIALGYADIESQILDRTYFPINHPLIRLEDVMLMYAEIVGIAGGKYSGIEMVNKIRTRAGRDELSNDAQASEENFFEAVQDERRRELAGEGIRWHDMVRWSTNEADLYFLKKIQEKFMNATNGDEVGYPDLLNRVVRGSYLYPIPDSQMKVKEGLYQQNEAYL